MTHGKDMAVFLYKLGRNEMKNRRLIMSERRIVLTGGGTAGHVSLNQAIIPSLEEQGFTIHYMLFQVENLEDMYQSKTSQILSG